MSAVLRSIYILLCDIHKMLLLRCKVKQFRRRSFLYQIVNMKSDYMRIMLCINIIQYTYLGFRV